LYKVYKAEKVNLGKPKPIKHIEIKQVETSVHNNDILLNEKNKDEIAKDIIEQAKILYADIIDEANAEAIKIIQNANTDIEKSKNKELQRAYQEGLEKGYKEGRFEAESIINQAKAIKTFLEQRKNEILKEAEEEVIKLVLEITRKLIGQELKQNNEVIINLIKQALAKSAYKEKLTIKVSTEDYINVLENKEIIESLVEGISGIEIIEDKFLEKGDCIVDTPGGQINTGMQLQIKELEEAFLYVLKDK